MFSFADTFTKPNKRSVKMQIDQNIVANYLNSRASDQQLKNGMMLATIKWMMEKQEQQEQEIKKLKQRLGDKDGSS
jgi:hypothetical protein